MSISRLNFKPDPNLLQTIRTEADFANLIHASTSTASRQLHKICSLPDSPIIHIGTGNRTVWVKKK